jgi:hypothetical protein
MGYTTDFSGEFNLDKPLSNEHKAYLEAFAENRRMARNDKIASKLQDTVRIAAGLPVGIEGAYFVNGSGYYGQDEDASVIDSNRPPSGQPGPWCQWVPSHDGTAIVWDSNEKFYNYVEWIEYLVKHFLKPWGYKVNGEVEWIGQDPNDRGLIVIENNLVKVKVAKIVYEDV